jgi:hypothetical protein
MFVITAVARFLVQNCFFQGQVDICLEFFVELVLVPPFQCGRKGQLSSELRTQHWAWHPGNLPSLL